MPGTQSNQEDFKVLGQILENDGWYPEAIEENLAYYMKYSGQNGFIHSYARIHEEHKFLICYATVEDRVPEQLRVVVMEFITRINYGLYIGNFELDYTDGEVRFKSSIDFSHITLTEALVKNTIYPAVRTFDRYMPRLMNVTYGNRTAIEVLEEDL